MRPFPNLTYFNRSEFDYPDELTLDTLFFIDQVRAQSGIPLKINSDVRTQADHERIYPDPTRRPNSPHLRNTAVDFGPAVHSQKNRMRQLWAVLDLWVQDQDSPQPIYSKLGLEIANRHLHIDFDKVLTRPHMWTGKSR